MAIGGAEEDEDCIDEDEGLTDGVKDCIGGGINKHGLLHF